jgi:hypothetical protein
MRKYFGFVSYQTLVMILMLGLLVGFSSGGFVPGQAFADGLDNFDDNSKDLAKWGTDEVRGSGQLDEANGRLEYTSANGSGISSSDRPWIATRFPYDADWSIQLDVTNTTSLGEFSSFGIDVRSVRLPDNEIEVELAQSNLFWSEFYGGTNISDPGYASGYGLNAFGAILLSFNAASKVFTVSYDIDPSDGYLWTEFGSFGVAGSGGSSGTRDWGLNDSDQFTAYLFGYSDGVLVTSGEIYGDNFLETGGLALPPPGLSVKEGTIGTEITITGSNFGSKKGKVLLGTASLKIAKGGWSGDTIIGTVKKVPLPAGSYPAMFDVTIQTKNKPPDSFVLTDAFTVTNPWISSHSPASGSPGTEVTVHGTFFGGKKGKVYLEGQGNGQRKNCKVTSWTMSPTDGTSVIKFIVPKVDAGNYWLYVSNKVGANPPGVPYQVN